MLSTDSISCFPAWLPWLGIHMGSIEWKNPCSCRLEFREWVSRVSLVDNWLSSSVLKSFESLLSSGVQEDHASVSAKIRVRRKKNWRNSNLERSLGPYAACSTLFCTASEPLEVRWLLLQKLNMIRILGLFIIYYLKCCRLPRWCSRNSLVNIEILSPFTGMVIGTCAKLSTEKVEPSAAK